MRLKPALILLAVFVLVIGALAVFVATYEGPPTDEMLTLRVKELFPDLRPGQVVRIEFTGPKTGNKPVVLERAGERKWRMTTPVNALASADKAARLLASFAAMQAARGFSTRSLEEYELAEPRYRMTVTTEGGAALTVGFGTEVAGVAGAGKESYMDFYTLDEVGGRERVIPHRYVRIGTKDEVLIVKDDVCPQLDVEPAQFRDPALVYAETKDAVSAIDMPMVRRATIAVREPDGTRRAVTVGIAADGRWRMLSPVNARADVAAVYAALGGTLALKAASDKSYVEEEPKDLSPYGLDKPAVTVECEVELPGRAKPESVTVRFGKSPALDENLVYAQSSSRNAVILVPTSVVRLRLSGKPEDFRDRRLVAMGGKGIQSATFAYATGRPPLRVARRPNEPDKWQLEEPVSGRAVTAGANALVNKATGLMVDGDGFVTEDDSNLAAYGLDKPQLRVSFAVKGEPKPTEILIGGSPKDKDSLVYAKNAAEPSIVLVAKSSVEDLEPDVKPLRSTTLLEDYDRWSGAAIEILCGDKKVKLDRAENGPAWKFAMRDDAVDYTAPSDFLAAVADLKIEAWPADKPASYAPFGLDKPYATVTIQTKPEPLAETGEAQPGADAKTFVIQFGNRTPAADCCYVRLPSEPNVYEVKADILKKIARGDLEFRSRQVLDVGRARAKSFRIEGGRTDYAGLQSPNREWLLMKPLPVLGDKANIDRLIAALASLEAKELVSEGDVENPRYGLTAKGAKPYRVAALTFEKPPADKKTVDVTKTLVVGAAVPEDKEGDRYAAVLEDNRVFVMAGADVKKLDAELVSSEVMDFTKPSISRVSVVHRDGTSVEVAALGARWDIASHKAAGDPAKIEKLADEAGTVRAEGFVAYGQTDLAKYGLDKPLITVTVTPRGKMPAVLRIGDAAKDGDSAVDAKKGKRYYATGGAVPAVFLLSEEKVKALNCHVEDLLKGEAK